MRGDILILRPQPGAGETAARARAFGLHAAVTPLFRILALGWNPLDSAAFDAIFFTSANAPQQGGEALQRLVHLPCYAVGESTAAAAREAGFRDVRIGPSDGAALLEIMVADGVRCALHVCGRDHIPLHHPQLRIERQLVYAAEPAEELPPEAQAALKNGFLPLLHSPRAAERFAMLVDRAGLRREDIVLAAISEAASSAAGSGWKEKAAAASPRDEALLELAQKLCKVDARAMGPE